MSESCAVPSGRSRDLFRTGVLTRAGSRYFRQLQEISDSVGEAHRNDVDEVGLALQRNTATQNEIERKIITGRARQRYVRVTLFRPAREALIHEFSSPIWPKRRTPAKMKRTRAAFCVRASSSVDTSHAGEVRSSWSMPVHRC